MRAVVIYESMYGNTHLIATAIGVGLGDPRDVTVVPVAAAARDLLDAADLVVVGGPTHVHGMSRPSSRQTAMTAAQKPGRELPVDPDAAGEGLREWFDGMARLGCLSAAFDTRFDGPASFTGRASKGIARRLRDHGMKPIADPESFLVTRDNHLEPQEAARAQRWGARLLEAMGVAGGPTTTSA